MRFLSPCLVASWLAVLSLAAMSGGVGAQGTDPLESADCRRAMAALGAHETAMHDVPAGSAPSTAALARHKAMQTQALRACLGSQADPAPMPARAREPVAVPPVAARALAAPPTRAVPATVQPSTRPAPSVVLSCDGVGCWANDGRYLFRQGPLVIGPNGACTAVGQVLMCP